MTEQPDKNTEEAEARKATGFYDSMWGCSVLGVLAIINLFSWFVSIFGDCEPMPQCREGDWLPPTIVFLVSLGVIVLIPRFLREKP